MIGLRKYLLFFLISSTWAAQENTEVVRRGLEGSLSHTLLRTLQNSGESPHNSGDLLGCGSCLSNLKIGDFGPISVSNSSSSCVWLLHTKESAEIELTCHTVRTGDSCRLSQGEVNMDNVLIIAPTWQFTRSWVYCGRATERLGTISHLSTCNKMAIIYKGDGGAGGEVDCRYHIYPTYK